MKILFIADYQLGNLHPNRLPIKDNHPGLKISPEKFWHLPICFGCLPERDCAALMCSVHLINN
jgi:hypothetical protein